jgi:cellulose biosynthesis protein BcsQ
MSVHSAALVGSVGGAGTTRLAVELGAAFARAGDRALVLDLDFDTQGLASHVPGRLSPDSTRLLTDPDVDLVDATRRLDVPAPGTLACCPAHAPFTRIAAAKAPAAAERLATRLQTATEAYDAVVLDVPPVAANPAVAAVTAADRTALVATPDERGVDAVQRARGRLADVGTAADHVLVTRSSPADAPPDADLALPAASTLGPGRPPAALADTPFARAVVETAEMLYERDLGIDVEPDGAVASLRSRLS